MIRQGGGGHRRLPHDQARAVYLTLAVLMLVWVGTASTAAQAQVTGTFAIVLDTSATNVTVAQAQTAAQTAVAWLKEVTWGRLTLSPVVYGPLSLGVDCSDTTKVWAATDGALARLGAPIPYRVATVLSGCPFSGKGHFYGRHIILNNNLGVLAHEVGHTFQIAHNSGHTDPGDPMNDGFVHFNGPHKGRIDWVLSTGGFNAVWPSGCFWDQGCNWQTSGGWDAEFSGSKVFEIAPTDARPHEIPILWRTPLAVDPLGRVIKYLYLEYRRPVGFDARVLTPTVHLHYAGGYNTFAPWGDAQAEGEAGATEFVVGVGVGAAWSDCDPQLTVTVVSVSSASALVDVRRDTCIPPPPPPPPPPPAPCWPPTSKKCR